MQSDENKKKGVLFMFLGILGFFLCFEIFHLSGAGLDSKNIPLLIKMIFTTAFIPAGLYFGLLYYAGKKPANQIGGGATIFLIIGYILGFLLH